MALFSNICVLFFIFSGVNFTDSSLQNYVSLSENVREYYGTSSVWFVTPNKSHHKKERPLVPSLCRAFSRKGILTLVMNIEEMIHHMEKNIKTGTQPLIIILLTSVEEIDNFREAFYEVATSPFKWLLIFEDEFNASICKYCQYPARNMFHLRFDTEMLVYCCKDPLLKEWWAANENETTTTILGNWTIENGFHLVTRKSLYTRRHEVNGAEFRVVIVEESAFHAYNDYNIDGYFYAVLLELKRVMKFKIKTIIRGDGTWVGAIDLMIKGEADIGVADFMVMSRRLELVDFTLPLMIMRKQLYFKKMDDWEIQWYNYFKPFSLGIWFAIILLVITTTLLMTLIQKKRRTYSCPDLFMENFLCVWSIFCQQGFFVSSTKAALRIIYCSIFISALVISAAYSSSLTSFCTVVTTSLPFSTVEEFVNDGSYRLIVVQNDSHTNLLDSSQDPVILKMKNLLKPSDRLPKNTKEGFQQVCTEKVGFLVSEVMVNAKKKYIPCDIVKIDTGIIDNSAMIMPAGSQYTGIVNYHIQRFQQNGILDRLKKKYLSKSEDSVSLYKEVSFWGVAPVFLIFAGGTILAFFIFSCEMFYKTILRRSRPRVAIILRLINSFPKNQNNSNS